MSIPALALVAFLPILVALVLMVGMRWPSTKAMPLAWLVCALSALLVWQLPVVYRSTVFWTRFLFIKLRRLRPLSGWPAPLLESCSRDAQ